MFEQWMTLPRLQRLGWSFALLAAGAILLRWELHFTLHGLKRHPFGFYLIGGGVTLVIVDLIFHKRYLDRVPKGGTPRDLDHKRVAVPPEKVAAVLNALALEFHGDFAEQKPALFATLAMLQPAEAKNLAFSGRLDGAPVATKLRVQRNPAGAIDFQFSAPPAMLVRLGEILGNALD